MKKYIIYKITNKISGKVYIGLTKRGLKVRFNEHVNESSKNPIFQFHKAIKKYGYKNFKKEILESNISNIKQANILEIFYIKKYDSYVNGYNMTKGGGGRDNYFFSKNTRAKMSKSKTGSKLSKDHKSKISNSLKGKPKTKKHNIKVGLSNLGKTHSIKTKKLISKKLKGKLSGSKNPSSITVKIFDESGKLQFTCNGNFAKVCK